MDIIKNDVKETKDILTKIEEKLKGGITSNHVEEEFEIDMKYKHEKEEMQILIDSGASISIINDRLLDKYREGKGLDIEVGKHIIALENSSLGKL